MTDETFAAVDQYIARALLVPDEALDAALRDSAAAGLPPISVSPPQGKFLAMLAQMLGAKRILEVGTLGGYSTIWLARALPADGKLVTIEADAQHADVARANIARAGLSDRVELRVGLALDVLPTLSAAGPFDFFFIDADKQHNADYFAWALKLARVGSVILVDNVIRGGKVIDAACAEAGVQGTRRFFAAVAAERRVSATAIQTVGAKGYDGFAMVRVID